MIRFLVVESTHLDSNSRFEMGVIYLGLIILLIVDDVPVNNETFLMTDFINIKIKPAQSFKNAHIKIEYVSIYL
jgi:hypothetical protein